MKRADADGENLTADEKERNKQTGDVVLFFQHDSEDSSEMKRKVNE